MLGACFPNLLIETLPCLFLNPSLPLFYLTMLLHCSRIFLLLVPFPSLAPLSLMFVFLPRALLSFSFSPVLLNFSLYRALLPRSLNYSLEPTRLYSPRMSGRNLLSIVSSKTFSRFLSLLQCHLIIFCTFPLYSFSSSFEF